MDDAVPRWEFEWGYKEGNLWRPMTPELGAVLEAAYRQDQMESLESNFETPNPLVTYVCNFREMTQTRLRVTSSGGHVQQSMRRIRRVLVLAQLPLPGPRPPPG